jgi:hypothetical protein
MKILKFISSLFIPIVLIGCSANIPKTITSDPSPQIKKATGDIDKSSNTINEKADDINKNTDLIVLNIKDPYQKTVIKPFVDKIKENIKDIKKETVNIQTVYVPIVIEKTKDISSIVNERDTYKGLYEKEKEKNDSFTNKIIQVIKAISLGGIFGTLIWFLIDKDKKILGYTGICLAIFATATFVDKYLFWIEIASMIGLVVYVIYHIRNLKKDADKKDSINVELVQFGEIVKDELKDLGDKGEEIIKKLFGSGTREGLLQKEVFSDHTIDKVDEIRSSGEIYLAKK